jgi:endonuclease/exonuclease/phosphatase (EEP) superfamily protein YafD
MVCLKQQTLLGIPNTHEENKLEDDENSVAWASYAHKKRHLKTTILNNLQKTIRTDVNNKNEPHIL